ERNRDEKRPSSAFGTFSPLAGRRKKACSRSRGEGKKHAPARGEKEKSMLPLAGRRKKHAPRSREEGKKHAPCSQREGKSMLPLAEPGSALRRRAATPSARAQ